MKFLLVDDSRTMRRIVRGQLNSIGFDDIIEAEDGVDALEKLGTNMPVDIVSLDINMPNMDGLECLRKIRSDPAYAKVKIIMLTSESEKEKVIEAVKAGANNYLVKPFVPQEFISKFGL